MSVGIFSLLLMMSLSAPVNRDVVTFDPDAGSMNLGTHVLEWEDVDGGASYEDAQRAFSEPF